MSSIREEAMKLSQPWWYCDNIVCHKGQIGLLRMDFPQVFILIRDDERIYCTYEEFRDCIAEVNFFNPEDRKDADIDAIITEAWNFMSLQEEEEERLYDSNDGYEL